MPIPLNKPEVGAQFFEPDFKPTVELPPNPLDMDHYAFLKALGMKDEADKLRQNDKTYLEKKMTQDKKELEQAIASMEQRLLAAKASKQPTPMPIPKIEAFIKKLKRVKEDLFSDPNKKTAYDLALVSPPAAQVHSPGKPLIPLVPLCPIKDIVNVFEEMKKKHAAEGKDVSGYKHEVREDGHNIFTMPTEAASEFLQTLFDKNMVMLPGGSQDLNKVFPSSKDATKEASPHAVSAPAAGDVSASHLAPMSEKLAALTESKDKDLAAKEDKLFSPPHLTPLSKEKPADLFDDTPSPHSP